MSLAFTSDALPNRFDAAEAQARIYALWEEAGYFHAEPCSGGTPYCIVIPPPNVTGALHLGHALNNTLQDIMIRLKRMQGYNTLWMPGTDHAGIATQAVVEKRLKEEENMTRHDLGREAIVGQPLWLTTSISYFETIMKPAFDRCLAGNTVHFASPHPGREPSEIHTVELEPIWNSKHRGRGRRGRCKHPTVCIYVLRQKETVG